MPRDAFVLKIQEELCHPKCSRKVTGLSRNGPLAKLTLLLKDEQIAHEQLSQFGRTDAFNLRIDGFSQPVLKNGSRPKSTAKVEHTLCQSGLNRVQLLASSRPSWKFPMVK